MLERFDADARAAIAAAVEEARRRGVLVVDPGHLLIGVATCPGPAVAALLDRYGITASELRAGLVDRPPAAEPSSDLQFSPSTKSALEFALLIAQRRQHRDIGCAHLLWGALAELGTRHRLRHRIGDEPGWAMVTRSIDPADLVVALETLLREL